MNPYIHFSPEQKKLLFAALATERNRMTTLKINLTAMYLEEKMKETLVNRCKEKITMLTLELDNVRRSTNEPLKLS